MDSLRRRMMPPTAAIPWRALLAALVLAPLASGAARGQAGTLSEAIVTDTFTGAALMGFDPVAYHLDGRPVPGRRELQASVQGRVWQFRNEGNREAFLSHPDAYTPLFGGYDPLGVARGLVMPGNPQVFAILDGRLLLFRDEANRAAFLARAENLPEAQSRWPEVKRLLVP